MLSTALQVAVFPRTFILLLLFLTTFIWIASILMLMLAARLKWILWDLSHSFSLRLAIIVFTIILLYSVGQVNVFTCLTNLPCKNETFIQSNLLDATAGINLQTLGYSHRHCSLPQYISLAAAFAFLCVSVFLR